MSNNSTFVSGDEVKEGLPTLEFVQIDYQYDSMNMFKIELTLIYTIRNIFIDMKKSNFCIKKHFDLR